MSSRILSLLKKNSYEKPTPIQAQAIPGTVLYCTVHTHPSSSHPRYCTLHLSRLKPSHVQYCTPIQDQTIQCTSLNCTIPCTLLYCIPIQDEAIPCTVLYLLYTHPGSSYPMYCTVYPSRIKLPHVLYWIPIQDQTIPCTVLYTNPG